MRKGWWTRGVRFLAGVVVSLLAACDGGGGGLAGTGTGVDASAAIAPGSTTFVRKLGGAGNERPSDKGFAAAADGSIVAMSEIGNNVGFPDELGITRIDAAGRTLWARSFAVHGAELLVQGVAVTPEFGNVFVGFAVTAGANLFDVGGGPIFGGVVVKFGPGGNFVWQRNVGGLLTGIAVDGRGSVLVGLMRSGQPFVAKYLWNGELVWERGLVEASENPVVAFDRDLNAIAAAGSWVFKFSEDGIPSWSTQLSGDARIFHVGTTALGTVVVGGLFLGPLTFAGTTLGPAPAGIAGQFLAAIERDARPRWLRSRAFGGPFSVDPEGRLAVLENVDSSAAGCTDVVSKWDLAGNVLWRRPLGGCVGGGARGVNIAVSPDHGIWVQGYATGSFDLGTGVLTTSGDLDWFLARLAP